MLRWPIAPKWRDVVLSARRSGARDARRRYGRSLRPEVVIFHIGKATERAQSARAGNAPAGFLQHFAVECLERGFSRFDTAAGQLHLGVLGHFQRHQKAALQRENGIDPGPRCVALAGLWCLTCTSDHLLPLFPWVAAPI